MSKKIKIVEFKIPAVLHAEHEELHKMQRNLPVKPVKPQKQLLMCCTRIL
jgi:hypothetical protein